MEKITFEEFKSEKTHVLVHDKTHCPCCGEKGRLALMQRIESGFLLPKQFAGLYCPKCQHAQSQPESDDWYFMAGGIHFPIRA